MMEGGLPIPVDADRPNVFNPIDLDDIAATVPALLEAATVPATITNWAGSEQVSLEQWCEFLAERCGLSVSFEETVATIGGVTVDTTRMESICGPTRTGWKDGFARLADAHLARRAAPAGTGGES